MPKIVWCADVAVVRDVRVGHEHVVVADFRDAAAARGAAMDRHELPEHVVVADDQPRRLAVILQVLRNQADRDEREDLVAVADLGKAAPIVLEKHWRLVPRGVALVIGCQTFPTWNSYPGLFASLATGNTVIVKPHPGATLPLALTVAVLRDVLAEAGLPARRGASRRRLARGAGHQGSRPPLRRCRSSTTPARNAFGAWVRENAGEAQVYTEEAGRQLDRHRRDRFDFAAMCGNVAFSLALYSGQMCTAPAGHLRAQRRHRHRRRPQVLRRGRGRHRRRGGRAPRRPGPRRRASPAPSPTRATLDRIAAARALGRVVRDSAPLAEGRSATPLIVAVDAADEAAYGEERFGPIAFVVAVGNAEEGIARAAGLARAKGAITAALYDTDEARILSAADAFARAGVNLSVNLTRRHLRQPERRLQRLSRHRPQPRRQRQPDRRRLRRQPLPAGDVAPAESRLNNQQAQKTQGEETQ